MDYFVPLPGTNVPDFTGPTLLLPQPSLSNVAQLACDLLVHNCALDLVGYLGLEDYVPAVGARDTLPGQEGPEDGLSLGTEVYTNSTRSITLVLPRSPVIRARKANHLESMTRFVAAGGFKAVLLVAGVDAALRGDEALNAPTPLRHLLPPGSAGSVPPLFASLQALAPPYSTRTSPDSSSSSDSRPQVVSLPHAGLTRSLLSALSSAPCSSSTHSPAAAALLAYTAEGDASPLAHHLASALARLLDLPRPTPPPGPHREGEEQEEEQTREWREPVSWQRGLLGVELEREGPGREMFS